jgi:hypothetical protein
MEQTVKVATLTSEAMNLAGLVRRGDDAAWAGIGPDAHLRAVAALREFADVVGRLGGSISGPVDLAGAAPHARALAEELAKTGVPVSERAQELATELLTSLGVDRDVLSALDGE